MTDGGRVIGIADRVVRVLAVLNIVCALGFALAIAATFPFAAQIIARIAAKYHDAVDAHRVLWGIRGFMVLGIIVAVPAAAIFSAMRAMLATTRAGDPFVAVNGERLARIGWALLTIQLLDLCFGSITLWIAHLGADVGSWSPSIGGWLSVFVAFVLARIFAVGAAMRDDLAGTV
ncbi:conserved membrane hypothetical protein [Sphingomonas sp. EC-HK361]|uniref:DUF2975 domain-containing protein n=1 Tax=Sphingomonas sp. EC-HK361 TaxID=2038397 RepID=UPI001250D5E9|nr:DUF2975 domain-containing protein [Sphingomonas sp. EC-HK361]VVT19062.1 conserved membrane hypothetical protein [Sphingomonas sp. EC-HK361]